MNAKERAVELFNQHIALAASDGRLFRKTVMDQLKTETGCSQAASATHYNNAKKGATPVAGLGREVVVKTPRKSDKVKPFEPEVPDNECYTVVELVKGENNIQVGRTQSFIMQGDASEKFDSKVDTWPNCTWVLIKGLGPLHGESFKLSSGELEIKRYHSAELSL